MRQKEEEIKIQKPRRNKNTKIFKHEMISFSWEEGAQIVEDLENDNIDQVGQ